MSAMAASASFCALLITAVFSSAVKLVPLISAFLSVNAALIALMASPSKASTASFTNLVRAFTWLAESFAPVAARTS